METVEFRSVRGELVICMESPTSIIIGTEIQPVPGKFIRFNNHLFRTKDPEEIAFLRSYDELGTQVFETSKQVQKVERVLKRAETPIEDMSREQLEAYADEFDLSVESEDTNEEIREAIREAKRARKYSQPAGV